MSDAPAFDGIPMTRIMGLFLYGLRHGTVTLTIDAGDPGVVLPAHLVGSTVLLYGLNLTIPIPDLRITRRGISATLSFGAPFKTFVPWVSIRDIAFEHALKIISAAELDELAANPSAVTNMQRIRPRLITNQWAPARKPLSEAKRLKIATAFATTGLRLM